jgi:hypothetical protein
MEGAEATASDAAAGASTGMRTRADLGLGTDAVAASAAAGSTTVVEDE